MFNAFQMNDEPFIYYIRKQTDDGLKFEVLD